MPDLSQEEFQAMDADADGMLNTEELAAAEEAGLIPAG
jgi:Ca2+-binding EF-hand superfamily protein